MSYTHTTELAISSLVPYESAAVRPTVDAEKKQLLNGKDLPPAVVVDVDGVYMVRDGNNTVQAYIEINRTHVPCTIDILSNGDYPNFRDTLALRKKKGQTGFARFPVVRSSDERAKLTKEEHDEMIQGDSWNNLAKTLEKCKRPVSTCNWPGAASDWA